MKKHARTGEGNPQRAAWMQGLPIAGDAPAAMTPPGVHPMPKTRASSRAGKTEGQASLIPPPSPESPSTPSALKKIPENSVAIAPSVVQLQEASRCIDMRRLKRAPVWIGPSADIPSPITIPASVQSALSILEAHDILSRPEYEPGDLARSILEYATRPLDGSQRIRSVTRDGMEVEADAPVSLPVPSFQEIARCLGLTKRELEDLGQAYPDTVGRALEIMRGVIEDTLMRRSLVGQVDGRVAMFVADNVTDLKIKKQVDSFQINVSDLLKKIEESNKPIRDL